MPCDPSMKSTIVTLITFSSLRQRARSDDKQALAWLQTSNVRARKWRAANPRPRPMAGDAESQKRTIKVRT